MVQDALGLIDPLVDAVENAVRYFFPKPVDVYCQDCGTDLKGRDANVSNSGRVYCRTDVVMRGDVGTEVGLAEVCGLFSRKESGALFTLDYRTAREVQSGIRIGAITHYSPLEETVRTGLDRS